VIYVYQFTFSVWLTRGDNGVVNNNMPLNTSDFTIWKNAPNNIAFIVRDVDRVPIDLTGASLLATIVDPESDRIILQRQVTITNATAGMATLSFIPIDSEKWDPGLYHYSILMTNPDASQDILYVDQNLWARGQFQVVSGILPNPSKVYTVRRDGWTPYNPEFNNTGETYYRSSAFPGNMQANISSPLHTFVVYPKEFSGIIRVQGSLAQTPDIEYDWFTIRLSNQQQDIYFDGSKHRIEAFNFYMNVQWVRFEYHVPPGILANTITLKVFPWRPRPPEKILFKN
jgi:hypothetical protein